jgi:hypothetical protein
VWWFLLLAHIASHHDAGIYAPHASGDSNTYYAPQSRAGMRGYFVLIPGVDFRGGTGTMTGIVGSTAYDCLRSMPFNPDLAVPFLEEYEKYLEFHSTVAILKRK